MEVDNKGQVQLNSVDQVFGESLNTDNGECDTNTAINQTNSVIVKEVKKEEQDDGEASLMFETNCMENDGVESFVQSEEIYIKLDEIKEESCIESTSQLVTPEPALQNTSTSEVTAVADNDEDSESDKLPKSRVEATMYKCPTCSYKGRRKKYLRQHMLCHSKMKMFQCEKCSYQSQYKNNLIRHTLTHKTPDILDDEDVEWYNCEICSFKTKYKRNIKSHMVCHLDVEMLECEVCSYKTKRRSCLTQHKLTHKSTSEVPMYACETCSYQTRYKVTMELHVLSHKKSSDDNMYECDICSYKGESKQYFRHHMLSHKRLSLETPFRRLERGNQLTDTS